MILRRCRAVIVTVCSYRDDDCARDDDWARDDDGGGDDDDGRVFHRCCFPNGNDDVPLFSAWLVADLRRSRRKKSLASDRDHLNPFPFLPDHYYDLGSWVLSLVLGFWAWGRPYHPCLRFVRD